MCTQSRNINVIINLRTSDYQRLEYIIRRRRKHTCLPWTMPWNIHVSEHPYQNSSTGNPLHLYASRPSPSCMWKVETNLVLSDALELAPAANAFDARLQHDCNLPQENRESTAMHPRTPFIRR
jgi:hypothetical protein